MQFLLQKAHEQVEAGLAAQQTGRPQLAQRHYLQAAEYLFQAAAKSKGTFKAQRIAQAEELIKRGEAVANQPVPPASRPTAAPAETNGADSDWLVQEKPSIGFKDVAGLEEVKEQIRLKLLYPFTHPELADKFGIKRGGGILLYGPPGTGKTLIARATAGEIEAAFFAVKPSEVMSKWVGEAEQNIQKLFATARRWPRSVIFIDEVESLVPKRSRSNSTVMQRVVPQILAELEGFEQKEADGALLFIGATNEPWALDPAVLRPGRFDEKIYVGLPDLEARHRIIELQLALRPLATDITFMTLAERLVGYSGADIVNICHKASAIPFIEGVKTGQSRDMTWTDFETVLETIRPSVSEKQLAKYKNFRWDG